MTSDSDTVTALLRVLSGFGALLLLTSCNPTTEEREDQSSKIQKLEQELAARDADITALKELLVEERLKPKQQVAPPAVGKDMEDRRAAHEAEVEPVKAARPSRYPNMCYKDYCPCKGRQGGPDMVLCDQLEQGIDPAVDLMIAGRKIREARREIATER